MGNAATAKKGDPAENGKDIVCYGPRQILCFRRIYTLSTTGRARGGMQYPADRMYRPGRTCLDVDGAALWRGAY